MRTRHQKFGMTPQRHAELIRQQWHRELMAKQRQESIERRQQQTLKRSLRHVDVQEAFDYIES